MPAKMNALVFSEVGKVAAEEVAKPSIQVPADAIVKVTAASICGSDLHMIHNEALYQPGDSLGHEFVGVIDEIGSEVPGFKSGDRVAVSCTVQCGQCDFCIKGLPASCRNGGLFGGGIMLGGHGGAQSEYVRVPFARYAMEKIPDGLSDEQVLFVGDILSTGLQAVEKGNLQQGDTVAIFGSGPVGLCATAAAKMVGPAQIIVVEPIENRLEAARAFGATETINPEQTDAISRIIELTSNGGQSGPFTQGGVDVAIEAVGIEPTFSACFQAVKPGGHVSIVGVYREEQTLPMPLLCIKNFTLTMGLVNVVHMPRLMNFIEWELLDLTPLVTHTLPLSEGPRAYEIFESKQENVLKIVLKP